MNRKVLAGGALLAVGAAVAAHVEGGRIEAHARDLLGEGIERVEQVVPKGPTRVDEIGPMPAVLRESSGLAASRAHPGTYWSNNDSGDGARLYALDGTAALVATLEVLDVRADDWEALDLGVCPSGGSGRWCLYVGDIGDNAGTRPAVRVHVVPEPDPRAAPRSVRPLGTVHFSYPEGPADAEALAVTPEGDLVVVTKWGTPRAYEITAADVRRSLERGDTLRLGAGRELPVRSSVVLGGFPTGASLDAKGRVLAVRTYTDLHFFAWPLGDPPAEAAPPCFLGTLQQQGEAVALLGDGRALLSSESPGTSTDLLAVACEGAGT